MTEQTKPRGRPRPQETIDRDARILKYLRTHGPQSRNALAKALDEPKSKVWLALNRLRNDGLVSTCRPAEKTGADVMWTAGVSEPCP